MSTFHQSNYVFGLGGQRSLAEKMFDPDYVLLFLQVLVGKDFCHTRGSILIMFCPPYKAIYKAIALELVKI